MFKKVIFILWMGVVFVSGCSPQQSFSPDEVILNAMASQEKPFNYYGEIELVITNGEETVEKNTLKEWRHHSGKVRIETYSETGELESITVNDGKKAIAYEPLEKRAFVIEDQELMIYNQASPKEQAYQLLAVIQDSHDVKNQGEEVVAGRETIVIEAEPHDKYSLFGHAHFWIDKENWLIIKMLSELGDQRSEMVYQTFELEANLSDDLFTLELPEDVTIQDLNDVSSTTETTIDEAANELGQTFLYFPEENGIEIARVDLTEIHGVIDRNELSIEYMKGDIPYINLSVFPTPENLEELPDENLEEMVSVRGQKGTYIEFGTFRSLSWDESGLTYSVLLTDPNLTLDTLISWADRMDWIE